MQVIKNYTETEKQIMNLESYMAESGHWVEQEDNWYTGECIA